MRPRRSLADQANIDELIARLGRLEPASARRWGTMDANEMLCHLADSFASVLGEKPFAPADTWWSRNAIKWLALHTPLPWPPGVPTRPEVDPKRAGTRPGEFERDRDRVLELLRRFVSATGPRRHPTFGQMSRNEWLLWGYGHVDHHLRQFGV